MGDADVRQNPAPTRLESSSHGEDRDDSRYAPEVDYSALAYQPKMRTGKVLRVWAWLLDGATNCLSSCFLVFRFTNCF